MNSISKLTAPVSTWIRSLPQYYQSGEINFIIADKEGAMKKIENHFAAEGGKVSKLDGIKIEFADWWFNVRPSNTEPLLRLNLEARSEDIKQKKLNELSEIIKS